mgnify:CR=1 FL=1
MAEAGISISCLFVRERIPGVLSFPGQILCGQSAAAEYLGVILAYSMIQSKLRVLASLSSLCLSFLLAGSGSDPVSELVSDYQVAGIALVGRAC